MRPYAPRKNIIHLTVALSLKITEKVSFNKFVNLASFWKTEACEETVLPDRSILRGQKLVENAKIEKLNWDILDDFQTLCVCVTLFYAP